MSLKIVCSGYQIRYPVGGFSGHHLQYLLGFERLGCDVTYFEHFGWANSCFNTAENTMSDDPSYGIDCLRNQLKRFGSTLKWCYLAGDGSEYGMTRDELSEALSSCDIYFNLSNINWIPEIYQAPRRVLIDTDPVFTQIRAHGLGGYFVAYDRLFTYGQNVHRPGCTMPTAGQHWLPTRQPIVLDLWPRCEQAPRGPFTTLMNWSAYGEHKHDGQVYGQKDREFSAYFDLPGSIGEDMEIATHLPTDIQVQVERGGWRVSAPGQPNASLSAFQQFISRSAAEFSVAKHAYVTTRSGWFSDRSAAYLAMGRPVVLQQTGFSDVLPCGQGLRTFQNPTEAGEAIRSVRSHYDQHARSARELAEQYFDSDDVLSDLLEKSLAVSSAAPVTEGIA